MMQKAIKIHQSDNVAVALLPLEKGQKILIGNDYIELLEAVAAGHKFALSDLSSGSEVIKYGFPIGHVIKPIRKGEWVHTHNLKTGLGEEMMDYKYQPLQCVKESHPMGSETEYFYGYRREDGKAGIRNEIWIIPTVGCVNDIARLLEKKGKDLLGSDIDDVIAFTHPYGCSQLGDDLLNTQKILSGLIHHPNAAGVLVLGLGCENNHIDQMKKVIGDYSEDRVKFLVCQECENEIEQGVKLLQELDEFRKSFQKERIPVSELIVGLKCGGSDGLSGITANPVVGAFSDMLTAGNGTTILTEVPEMFGAETILMNRCSNAGLFDQTVSMIKDFKNYYMEHGQPIYENPSPGNKEGGITTLEDKSLGCTQKSGTSKVMGVLQYGERAIDQGLLLLSAPGNDLVATTALVAAGAHLILFTTGRGTPFGTPVPTIKISSNSTLSNLKKNWIDFNAGRLMEGQSLDELSNELYQFVLSTASGQQVKNEVNGYRDIAIFKQGVTL